MSLRERERLLIWPALRRVWESRGYELKEVSDALTKRFGSGFSLPELTRLMFKEHEVPVEVRACLLDLEVRPGFEEKARAVGGGLVSVGGGVALAASVRPARQVCSRRLCSRRVILGGLCRRHLREDADALGVHERLPVRRGQQEANDGKVLFGGLRLEPKMAEVLARHGMRTNLSPRELIAEIIERWADRQDKR